LCLLARGRMPLRLGAPPRNYVAAIYRGGCPRDAGRALQVISARPLLWRESVCSFRKHLDVRWKELGFASARMAQRYAAAALGMTQVGGGTTRARPLHPPPAHPRAAYGLLYHCSTLILRPPPRRTTCMQVTCSSVFRQKWRRFAESLKDAVCAMERQPRCRLAKASCRRRASRAKRFRAKLRFLPRFEKKPEIGQVPEYSALSWSFYQNGVDLFRTRTL
jgi:hypothetical protein